MRGMLFSMTRYAPLIRTLRAKRGVLQADVAVAAGMSRPSYSAVEAGTKELSLAEAVALTNYFGISLDDLVKRSVPDDRRYEEMLRGILRCAFADRVALKKTKLAKLLYLVDFSWYYQYKKSMSGQPYRKLAFGPTPDIFFRLIEDLELGGVITITQIARDDYHMYEIAETISAAKRPLTLLSKPELLHIEKVWRAWREASTAEIVAFTAEQSPYRDTTLGEILDYNLVLTLAPHEVV